MHGTMNLKIRHLVNTANRCVGIVPQISVEEIPRFWQQRKEWN
jgi:hypothetical protein